MGDNPNSEQSLGVLPEQPLDTSCFTGEKPKNLDYGDDVFLDGEGKDALMEKLTKFANKHVDLEEKIDAAEKTVANLKGQLKEVSESTIPGLMQELRLDEIKTSDGFKVLIIKKMRASIPAKDMVKKSKALQWLIDNGFENLIKRSIDIEFSRNESDEAKAVLKELEAGHPTLNLVSKEGVHPNTLSAFVNEQMELGKQIPKELFQAHEMKTTKIELPKK
jgi:ABC-type Fe3+-citrate transport system substrate-binding protein